MKLFRYEGYKLHISEEAFLLKPFKEIWNRDKTKDKDKALQELGYIYFMCDPRSDYQYIIDEDERAKYIREGEGIDSKWKPDNKVIEAMKFYNSFKNTATLLLEDIRNMVEGYRMKMREITKDMSNLDVKEIKDVGIIIKQIPQLVKDLDEAEKAITKEIMQNDKIRGSAEKSMYEDLNL